MTSNDLVNQLVDIITSKRHPEDIAEAILESGLLVPAERVKAIAEHWEAMPEIYNGNLCAAELRTFAGWSLGVKRSAARARVAADRKRHVKTPEHIRDLAGTETDTSKESRP